jgi:hypothetical protein
LHAGLIDANATAPGKAVMPPLRHKLGIRLSRERAMARFIATATVLWIIGWLASAVVSSTPASAQADAPDTCPQGLVWREAVPGDHLCVTPAERGQVRATKSAAAPPVEQSLTGVLAPGNAAVTGFSGAVPPVQIAPGVDPGEQTFIDLAGPSLRIIDLQHMGAPPSAQLVDAPKPYTWFANQIGQVFAVAIDDATPPNIYAAATSAYGLPIIAPELDGQPQHVKAGAPNATFMPGLWGPQGGPGSIWKIDGVTGKVSLFADVVLGSRTNSGAALGGLAFDADSKSLFVADRETGFIHRFGMNGRELGHYGHGVTGREAQGLPAVHWNVQQRIDVTNPLFDSQNPATWNYAVIERRVFGLAVYQHRLYYAVAAGSQIWSVGLKADGSFDNDAMIELIVPPASGPTEISKITFDEQGRMLLAERPAPTGAYDFEALTPEGIGRVLRYAIVGSDPNRPRVWQPQPDEYAIGFPLELRNGNGGIVIGNRYDQTGKLDPLSCGGFLWSTGERLRESSDPTLAARLAQSGSTAVNGLQGNDAWLLRRQPPLDSYFIDYDDQFDDAARGHMGDVALQRVCAAPVIPGAPIPGPGPPSPRFGGPPTRPNVPPPPPIGGECTAPNMQIGNRCCTPADLRPGALARLQSAGAGNPTSVRTTRAATTAKCTPIQAAQRPVALTVTLAMASACHRLPVSLLAVSAPRRTCKSAIGAVRLPICKRAVLARLPPVGQGKPVSVRTKIAATTAKCTPIQAAQRPVA